MSIVGKATFGQRSFRAVTFRDGTWFGGGYGDGPFDVEQQWRYTTGLAVGAAYQTGVAVGGMYSTGAAIGFVEE